MKLKKILSGCLAAVMLVSTVTVASAASAKKEAKDFPDFDEDAWYAEAVSAAVDNDLLRGTDKGKLNPQGNLTRAEMAAIANRAFGTYVKANITKFKDVSKNAWYYEDIQMAYWMGTYQGTGNSTMAPDKSISRQEVMTILARALQLDLERYEKTSLVKFGDGDEAADWALPYVKAMVGSGYVRGRNTGLDPLDNITRAEYCQMIHNIIKEYIVDGGSYTGDRKGNLLIRTDDVELKDMTIDGDLILGCGIADGKITLDNVSVTGRVVVWGGGTEAVYMNNGTQMSELIVCRVDEAVKVIFDKASTMAVKDDIAVEITERADAFKETEVIFYDLSGILEEQDNLNDFVDQNQISVTVPAHLYAVLDEKAINTMFSNDSKTDTYKIELREKGRDDLICDTIELSAEEICPEIELYETWEIGDYPCIATVTALRDGEIFGTVEIALTLHVANMWSVGG